VITVSPSTDLAAIGALRHEAYGEQYDVSEFKNGLMLDPADTTTDVQHFTAVENGEVVGSFRIHHMKPLPLQSYWPEARPMNESIEMSRFCVAPNLVFAPKKYLILGKMVAMAGKWAEEHGIREIWTTAAPKLKGTYAKLVGFEEMPFGARSIPPGDNEIYLLRLDFGDVPRKRLKKLLA